MNIIKPVVKAVNKVLGEQAVVQGKYIPSMYNHVQCFDDVCFVYNTFTRSLVSLNKDEASFIQMEADVSSAKCCSELCRALIANRFLVPESLNELELYKSLFDILRGFDSEDYINDYTILTTTGCNARCFYCFEADFVPVPMKLETADALVNYIAANNKGKHVSIHWFGGEPLCNTPVIDRISNGLTELGVSFTSSITTNGLLFNNELIHRAKEVWKLTSAQITLDGMNAEHNQRKNFKGNCQDPFNDILENIKKMLDVEILTNIRINFDGGNLESVETLIRFLIDQFEGCPYVSVSPTILYENCSAWKSNREINEQYSLRDKLLQFRDVLSDHNLYRKRKVGNTFKTFYCGSNGKHFRTVNPDGRFSVCHNFSDQCAYGSVFDGIDNRALFNKWKEPGDPKEKCASCKWLPNCTPYSMCPIKKSDCFDEQRDITNRQMLGEYKKWIGK